MAAITAAMVGELRAKTDAPMMECKKALTEADGDMGRAEEILRVKLGGKASKAASRVTAEGVVATYVNGNAGRPGRSQQRNRLRRQERRLPGACATWPPSWSPRRTRPTWLPWPRCRSTRQDLRRSAHRTDRQNRREYDRPPLPALRDHRQAGLLPARHPHRRDRRVHRCRRASRQGYRDAHRRDEAGLAVVGPGAGRADRERAFGRPAEGPGRRRQSRRRRQAAAIGRDRRQADRRFGAEIPEGSLVAEPAFVKNDKQSVERC